MSYEFKPYPFTARRYEAELPALTDGIETKRHAVAIVGGGPVGLALALGLANHGVASVLIEADDTVCSGSRAICISRRSLEIIERLGALQGFLEKGLPWTGGRSFYRDTEVLHFAMPHDENQKLPPMVNIEQFYIEQFLLDAAEKRADLIDIRWQTRATAIRVQDERRDARPFHTEGRLHAAHGLVGGLRRRPQPSAGGARPAAQGHELRRPLRDRRHRAQERPSDRAAGLVRPAVQPGLHHPHPHPAGQYLAHRLPAARRRGPGRGGQAGKRHPAGEKPSRDDGRDAATGRRSGSPSTRRTRYRSRTIVTGASCSLAMPRISFRSLACAGRIPASTTPTTSPGSSPSSSRDWPRIACSTPIRRSGYSPRRRT